MNFDINYIVSGLERSGTSMMMQILESSEFSIAYDNRREPDKNNPKGYYELHGGKIINQIMENKFNFDSYVNTAIKITAFGLRYLPTRKYKILYMIRDIDEIMKSQNIMLGIEKLDVVLKSTIEQTNDMILTQMRIRDDVELLKVYHRNLMENPKDELSEISEFLDFDVSDGISVIDNKLYRSKV